MGPQTLLPPQTLLGWVDGGGQGFPFLPSRPPGPNLQPAAPTPT